MGVSAVGWPWPSALSAPLDSVGEFLGWAAVAQGGRHSGPISVPSVAPLPTSSPQIPNTCYLDDPFQWADLPRLRCEG